MNSLLRFSVGLAALMSVACGGQTPPNLTFSLALAEDGRSPLTPAAGGTLAQSSGDEPTRPAIAPTAGPSAGPTPIAGAEGGVRGRGRGGGSAPASTPSPTPTPGPGDLGVSIPRDVPMSLALESGTAGALPTFQALSGIGQAADGTLYVGDTVRHCVWALAPGAAPRVVAGGQGPGSDGENVLAAGARLSTPGGLAVDRATGTVFVADTGNQRVRMFTPGGRMFTYAGGGGDVRDITMPRHHTDMVGPTGLALNSRGDMYVTERGSGRVRRLTTDNRAVILAKLPAGLLGAIAAAPSDDRVWVAAGSQVRLFRADQATPLQADIIYDAGDASIVALVYDPRGFLLIAQSRPVSGGLPEATLLRLPLTTGGLALHSAYIAGGRAGQGADDSAYEAPESIEDATTTMLAPIGPCGLFIDLRLAADPQHQSGQIYAATAFNNPATGRRFGQVLRLGD